MIDITGIDQAELLVSLYRNARGLGLGALHAVPEITRTEAETLLKSAGAPVFDGWLAFDWVMGKPIKVRMSATQIDNEWLYDRDAGEGACARAVEEARATSASVA